MKLDELQTFQGGERSALRQWLNASGMNPSQIEMLFRLFNKKNQGQGASAQELQTLDTIEELLHNLASQGISGLKRTDQIAKQGQSKRDKKEKPITKSSNSLDGVDMPLAASKDYDADPINEAECGCCGNNPCDCPKDCDGCRGKVDESLGYAMPGQDEDKETVTYTKTKKQGDSSVTVSANADSMDELHDILRLAGITLPKSDEPKHDEPEHDEPEHDHEEPEAEVCGDCGQADCGCDDQEPEEIVVKGLPQDDKPNYSTDKEVLINYLKDKLTKSVG